MSKNNQVELLMPLEQAKVQLGDRIKKGKGFLKVKVISEQELSLLQKDFNKWDDYNIELLKRFFSSNDLSDEYSHSVPYVGGVVGSRTLQSKINSLKFNISERVDRIESIFERLELYPNNNTRESKVGFDRSKVFIVHGHDNESKLEVARFITKLSFEPIILHEQVSGSKTIIEKIESYSDVGFGIVIYTPCDVGSKQSDSDNLQGRARQNVVFEHGYLIGKLGRSKVCPLVKGSVETPNDISGIVYTSMDTSNWQVELAKELKAAGYDVDMNKVFE